MLDVNVKCLTEFKPKAPSQTPVVPVDLYIQKQSQSAT